MRMLPQVIIKRDGERVVNEMLVPSKVFNER